MELVCMDQKNIGIFGGSASQHKLLKGPKLIYDEEKHSMKPRSMFVANPYTIENMGVLEQYQDDVNEIDIGANTEVVRSALQKAKKAERELVVQMNKVILHVNAKKATSCQSVFLDQSYQEELRAVDHKFWELYKSVRDFLEALRQNMKAYNKAKEQKRRKIFDYQNKRVGKCGKEKCQNYVKGWTGTSMDPITNQGIDLLLVYKTN